MGKSPQEASDKAAPAKGRFRFGRRGSSGGKERAAKEKQSAAQVHEALPPVSTSDRSSLLRVGASAASPSSSQINGKAANAPAVSSPLTLSSSSQSSPAGQSTSARSGAGGVGTLETHDDSTGAAPDAADAFRIRVFCRVRPLSQAESASSSYECVSAYGDTAQVVIQERRGNDARDRSSGSGPPRPGTPTRGSLLGARAGSGTAQRNGSMIMGMNGEVLHQFAFDHVFEPGSSQEDVFEAAARPMVASVLDGFNATVFCYGQTSAGKTYTMQGSADDPSARGLVPRSIASVFQEIASATEDIEFAVKVSYLEIYNDNVRDLLDLARTNLRVSETGAVHGLTWIYVSHETEVFSLLELGEKNRHVGATRLNQQSSRSHAIFKLSVTATRTDSGRSKTGTLTMVDLAGSEKVGKTGAEGVRLEEAKRINRSLLALINVINALAENARHVQYRDSRLTQVLRDALGGNCQTAIILNVSPASTHASESVLTCKFGKRAKFIRNRPIRNEEVSPEELRAELKRARAEIVRLRAQVAGPSSDVEPTAAPASPVDASQADSSPSPPEIDAGANTEVPLQSPPPLSPTGSGGATARVRRTIRGGGSGGSGGSARVSGPLFRALSALFPAAHVAARLGDVPTLKDLLMQDASRANDVDADGRLPSHAAASAGHCEILRVLAGAGASLEAADARGQTVGHAAALRARADVFALLAELSAAGNGGAARALRARDETGATPLHLVCSACGETPLPMDETTGRKASGSRDPTGGLVALEALCAALADQGELLAALSAPDDQGKLPLHYAAAAGSVSACGVLSAHGADATGRDNAGNTPLHIAALQNCAGVCSVLIARGGAVAGCNDAGETPLVACLASLSSLRERSTVRIEAAKELAKGDRRAAAAVAERGDARAATCAELVRHGAPLDAAGNGGAVPTMLAAERGLVCAVIAMSAATKSPANLVIDAKDAAGLTALHVAAERSDDDLVAVLLALGASPEAASVHGATPLHSAAYRGARRAAAALAVAKSDRQQSVLISDESGKLAIHVAAARGHATTLSAIVLASIGQLEEALAVSSWAPGNSASSDSTARAVPSPGANGQPLHVDGFTASGKGRVFEHLMRCGSAAGNGTRRGSFLRAKQRHSVRCAGDAAQLAVRQLSAQDGRGRTALHIACERAYTTVVEAIIGVASELSIDVKPLFHCIDHSGATPFTSAVSSLRAGPRDALACATALRNGGAVPDSAALRAASVRGSAALARFTANAVLECVTDDPAALLAADADGRTALHIACEHGHEGAVVELLAAASDAGMGAGVVQAADVSGATALHDAAALGNGACIRALLGAGAVLDVRDVDGCSPLHVAVRNGRAAAVRTLLRAGANSREVDRRGRTAAHVAAISGRTEALLVLLETDGALVDAVDAGGATPLIRAAERNRLSAIKALLRYGADPKRTDRAGETALHRAARSAAGMQPDAVTRVLLEKGAAISACNMLGETALLVALDAQAPIEVVQALLMKGASATARDGLGATCLHRIAVRGGTHAVSAIEEICSAVGKADGKRGLREFVNAQDGDLATAAHIAARNQLHALVAVLVRRGADVSIRDAAGRSVEAVVGLGGSSAGKLALRGKDA